MNTHMNTSSKKPYRYKVYMNDQDTDKGEVGGSSPPRPTTVLGRKARFNRSRVSFSNDRLSRLCLTPSLNRWELSGNKMICIKKQIFRKKFATLMTS